MSAARESDQSDFDLERFIDMFDEALTSKDERVINALRSLMMMVILTKPEGRKDAIGPLRQLFDDLHNINRRVRDIEDTLRSMQRQKEEYYKWDDLKKYSLTSGRDIFKEQHSDELVKIRNDFIKQLNGGKI